MTVTATPAIYRNDGETIDYRPVLDTPAGSVVVLGELVGVTVRDIAAGALGGLRLTGVFDVPRLTGGVIAPGFRIYWDEASSLATTNDASGANPYLGKAVAESGDTDATVRVRLDQ